MEDVKHYELFIEDDQTEKDMICTPVISVQQNTARAQTSRTYLADDMVKWPPEYPDGYRYTQFITQNWKWRDKIKVSGILENRAALLVDFIGKKISYLYWGTGYIITIEIFLSF